MVALLVVAASSTAAAKDAGDNQEHRIGPCIAGADTTTSSTQIDEMFSDEEQDLLRSGLHALLGVKKAAYEEIEIARMTGHPMIAGMQAFKPEDFGIPNIEALIQRLS